MEIRLTGLKEVRGFMKNIEPKLKKEVGQKGTFELAKRLQQRIRSRYSRVGYGKRSSSGEGFNSIIAKPTQKGAKVIIGEGAPWVIMFEQGVRDHWVSPYTIKKHLQSPGSTFGKRAPKGKYGGSPIMWHWKGPFVEPAMETFKPQIQRILIKSINKVIKSTK